MDFWASLEHKIYYKFEGNAPGYISKELKECAEMVSSLDESLETSVKKNYSGIEEVSIICKSNILWVYRYMQRTTQK